MRYAYAARPGAITSSSDAESELPLGGGGGSSHLPRPTLYTANTKKTTYIGAIRYHLAGVRTQRPRETGKR